jgi:hypothetical protein
MTDQTDKENCYKDAERIYAEWAQGCEIRDCEKEAHAIHEPKFMECNNMTDPEEA